MIWRLLRNSLKRFNALSDQDLGGVNLIFPLQENYLREKKNASILAQNLVQILNGP